MTARPSYAAALKKDEADWHLEFTMGEQNIPLDTTVYGAVHRYEAAHGSLATAKTMWTNIYTVKFRKVAGPLSPISAFVVSSTASIC